jgi:hypothetical protein
MFSGSAAQGGLWFPRPQGFLITNNDAPQSVDLLLDEWSAGRRDLYLTTHNTQYTNIQAPGGIWTHDRRRRAAAGTGLSGVQVKIIWHEDKAEGLNTY